VDDLCCVPILDETCLRTNHLRLLTNRLRLLTNRLRSFEGRAVLLSDAAVTGSDGKGAEHVMFSFVGSVRIIYVESKLG